MSKSLPFLRPLADFPAEGRRAVSVVLTDIDDTLTVDGYLPAVAYAAMERLRSAGLKVVPVTGRPAGWCDLIARIWPVDGVVGENGAFYFRYRHDERRMVRRYALPDSERSVNRQRLEAIRAQVLRDVPACRISTDQAYREADLAVDFAEDVGPLSDAEIDRIVAVFEDAGACAKVSSIHVNGWFGDYDKLGMSRQLLADEFGIDINRNADNAAVVFAGDSPNDEPMFKFFRNSVAVANFAVLADRVTHLPQWLTSAPGGYGFDELAAALLDVRDAA